MGGDNVSPKRENAGRPRLAPDEKHPPRRTVTLPSDLDTFAREFGDGSVSLGIRLALSFTKDEAEQLAAELGDESDVTVTLSPEQSEIARRLGNGDIVRGVGIALERAKETK
jgi:hypothetical protein